LLVAIGVVCFFSIKGTKKIFQQKPPKTNTKQENPMDPFQSSYYTEKESKENALIAANIINNTTDKTPNTVEITNLKIPFASMIALCFKWQWALIIASIPLFILVLLVSSCRTSM
jgi:uncharacterized protein YpmS